jgi:peptide/nickel transport system substrate-binding protein
MRLSESFAAAALILCFWLFAFQVESANAVTARTALRVGRGNDSVTLDPGATTRATDFSSLRLAYETLVELETVSGYPTGRVTPALSSKWETTDLGRTWVFRISPGHRFESGRAVDAQAVSRSFKRLMVLGLGPSQVLSMVSRVEATAEDLVTFYLNARLPVFPQLLSLPMFGVVEIKPGESGTDDSRQPFSEHTAGSGPYRLVRWERGQAQYFERNPYSPRIPRQFQEVILIVAKDSVSRIEQFRKGDFDICEGITPDASDYLRRSRGVRIYEGVGNAVTYLELNNTRRPLTDRRVRIAISQSIDRNAIVEGLFSGHASVPVGLLPVQQVSSDRRARLAPLDLDRARRLIREAGVSNGTRLVLSYSSANADLDALAVAVQSFLGELGLVVRLEELSPSAFNDKIRFRGDYDIAIREYSADFSDPWIVMNFLYRSEAAGAAGNVSRYRSSDVDTLLAQAASAMGAAERATLYDAAESRILDDQPNVPLVVRHSLIALRSDIVGFTPNFWQPQSYNVVELTRAR